MADHSLRSMWTTEDIWLRPVEPSDWEAFYSWNQDSEMAKRSFQVPFPQSRELTRKRVEEMSVQRPENDTFRWVIETRAGEIAGTINTHSCDRRHGTFAYGLGVSVEHRRKGYAAQAIQIVLRFFFQELGYQKVSVGTYSFNVGSIRLHECLGFQREGCQRRMTFTDGQYHDLLLYGMTVEEFAARTKNER